ncbi:MAG: ABC transporter permease, partial [Candidatus Marinimicrobia bacterium]|nr:ABC transporter permease [Candidatus Neomarinimicrobiota bacterium]
MINNYFKIAFRNIWRHKGYSFINIFGLAIGLTCCLLILLWVQDELGFDKFHAQADNLFRVEQDQDYSGRLYHVNVTPWPCVPAWKEEIPEVVDATRYGWCGGRSFEFGEKAFMENDIQAVDPAFFTMFDYPLIFGNRETIMDDPYSVVLNEKTAGKYFGVTNPIGEVFTVDNQFQLTVVGVLGKATGNSILDPSILVSIEFAKELGNYDDGWANNSIRSFILLQDNVDRVEINRKLTEVVNNHRDEASQTKFSVAPLTRVHLHSYFGFDDNGQAIIFVYIFSIIAGFVLLIACINFMNLATARSTNRAREIGIRKVVGAQRINLIYQFIGESLILSFLAVLVALIFVNLMLPIFNEIAGKEIGLSALLQTNFIGGLVIITLITGLIAGSYPALFLSAFRPVKVLKGQLTTGRSVTLRKILVIFQFTLSILLTIGTMVIYQQLNYMRSKDLGFNPEQVIAVGIRGDIGKSYESLKAELNQVPQVLGVSASSHRPTNIGSNSSGVDWGEKDPALELTVGMSSVDFDYIETMGITMVEGRAFSKEFPTDLATDDNIAFIINETLAQIMDKESIINENLHFVGDEGPIIGVMKDFHFRSVHNEIEPLAIFVYPEWFSIMLIRLAPGDVSESLAAVEKTWNQVLPNSPLDYRFLDEDFEWMYRVEAGMSRLIKYFSVLAIVIACLGLFGLASFTAEQRTKEIGIRKVLGASAANLVLLLSNQFTKWVLIANIIAFPIAYLILSKYLENYAYRIDLGFGPFLLAGVLALVIALLTVSFQAVKAA